MPTRTSGLLLHVTSLPGPFGIGDLGPAAHGFVDWLADAGQTLWQTLPLVPVGHGDSPYSSPSTFAGSPLLISPERLADDGLLDAADLDDAPAFPSDRVDFEAVRAWKHALIETAHGRLAEGAAPGIRAELDAFAHVHAAWLDDYALFAALKQKHGGTSWTDWPDALARRQPEALDAARERLADAVDRVRFEQLLFWRQWAALRLHARQRGVRLFGDLPIYVAHDSADVWANQSLFDLDEAGQPVAVAGVPPDYFSPTGQRWGNPLYRWEKMAEDDYAWWTRRLRHTLSLVDLVRIDHFRAFEAYWRVPADEPTAINGSWVEGPGEAPFRAFEAALGAPLPLVAEDLGLITPEVRALMERLGLPGMAVLQFAFGGGPENGYLPHHYRRRLVAYTGTHDNDTFRGWWADGASEDERAHARRYLGLDATRKAPEWAAIRALWASVADTVLVPVQDLIGLGGEARMNTPGEEAGNWAWRLAEALDGDTAGRLRELTDTYGRLPS
jgi:4-alpha-glucanotransferase